jgi:type VI secretion system protein ImpB
MSSESLQKKLDRVRRPRVQITYEVETGGAMVKTELPMVVGVLADLSAQRKDPLPAMRDRKFVPIDRDNFNDVMTRAAPRLAIKVNNRLTDDNTKIAAELNFKHIDDFEPARVARQIEPLKKLLDMREQLSALLSKMEGNDKLESMLADVLNNTDKSQALAQELGIELPAATDAPKPEDSK